MSGHVAVDRLAERAIPDTGKRAVTRSQNPWPPAPHLRFTWAWGEWEAAAQLERVQQELQVARETVAILQREKGAKSALEAACKRRDSLRLEEHDIANDLQWAQAALDQLSEDEPGPLPVEVRQ